MNSESRWSGAMPETYNRHLGPALFAPYAAHVGAQAESLAPDRILELAAGTGITTAELVRRMPSAHITATDLNPAMVDWAQNHVLGATWDQADAQQLGFADDSFDLVVCQFGVMFFPDRVAAYSQMARVLTPAGTVLVTSWDVAEASAFTAALMESLVAVLPDDPPSFIARVPHGYCDPGQIRADLTAGGLVVAQLDRVELQGRAESAHSLAQGYCRGTPLRFELEQRGPLEELTAAIADEMTARLGEGPIEGELSAFVVTARPAG